MIIVPRKNAPCKDCPNRAVDVASGYTCHNDCAAYLAYRADREAIYEAKGMTQEIGSYQKITNKKRKHEMYRRQKRQGRF